VAWNPARKSLTATVVGAGVMALVLTACGGGSNSASSSTSSAASSAASSPASSAAASGGTASPAGSAGSSSAAGPVSADSGWCDAVKSQFGDLTGKTVNVYTVIVAPEDKPYVEAYKPFTDCTGATVNYEGSKEFEAQIVVRVQSGNPPDVAMFPQPGLLSQIVNATGAVKPLPDSVKTLSQQYFPADWLKYGTVNDIAFGIPNNADFKSLVWYSPKTFKEKGYTVPTTWAELSALTEKIAATGEKPWCIGIKSGEATGWQITDWLEEYVLRLAGPEVYDQWVSHEVKFSDPQVADALKQVGDLIKNPKYVNAGLGDVNTIASTEFNDVAPLILNGKCTLSRQAANFDSNYQNVKIGPDGDIDAFYFPPIKTDFGQVVLGGGTFYAAFADRPEVQAFMYYITTPEYANTRAKAGSWISANKGLEPSSVPSPVQRTALEVLQNPETVFRFDASDLMPASVGSDAEWKQFTAWITGQDDATTLANIDSAWPTS
jgi:alpha-glucoside transport system substrate-binding protein